MIKRLLTSIACVLLAGSMRGYAQKTPADYVNPIIGASTSVSAGKSFHGLIQASAFPSSHITIARRISIFSPSP